MINVSQSIILWQRIIFNAEMFKQLKIKKKITVCSGIGGKSESYSYLPQLRKSHENRGKMYVSGTGSGGLLTVDGRYTQELLASVTCIRPPLEQELIITTWMRRGSCCLTPEK